MNKIYKVIFNKAKGCYEVVSELAKNNGKAHSTVNRMGKTVALSTLVALSLGMAAIPLGQVDASLALNTNGTLYVYQTDSKGNYIRDRFGNLILIGVSNQQTLVLNAKLDGETFASATGARSIAIGEGSNSSTSDSIAIGTDAKSINGTGAVALGANSISDRQDSGAGVTTLTRNPYIPTGATETQRTAINNTVGTTGAVSVGSSSGLNPVRRQIINVAAGSADSDAVNVAQLKAAVSQATNSTSVANGDNTTVIGSGSTSNPYRVTANTDNTTIATINNKLAAKTTTLTAGVNGTVTAGDTTSLVTGNSVAQAINNAGFTLTTGGNTTTNGVSQLVKAGNTVTVAGGTNISVT